MIRNGKLKGDWCCESEQGQTFGDKRQLFIEMKNNKYQIYCIILFITRGGGGLYRLFLLWDEVNTNIQEHSAITDCTPDIVVMQSNTRPPEASRISLSFFPPPHSGYKSPVWARGGGLSLVTQQPPHPYRGGNESSRNWVCREPVQCTDTESQLC